jgi:hypothetical protein
VRSAAPLRTQRIAEACRVPGCPRAAIVAGLCQAHRRRWEDRGRPREVARLGPVAVGTGKCLVAGCAFPTVGRSTFCDLHAVGYRNVRHRRRGELDEASYVAHLERARLRGRPRFDLRDLPRTVQLELQYTLQCRHDERGRLKRTLAVAGVLSVGGAGAALAAHVTEVDPATVPTGFLAAHNQVENIRISSLARAVQHGKADVFVQHARLGANEATGWHTHPGGVFVEVVRGSLTYEDSAHGKCRRATYDAGEGFFDPGFGTVHRAIAGPHGADFYPVYVLPPGTENHLIPATAPEACAG